MSDLDYDALRKVAEAANDAWPEGPWEVANIGWDDRQGTTYDVHVGSLLVAATPIEELAEFIAAFDPAMIARLLDLAQRADVAQAQVAAAGKALDAVTEYANAETARANAAEAKVERVTALADEWERRGSILPANQLGKPHAPAMKQAVGRLRAALDREEDQ